MNKTILTELKRATSDHHRRTEEAMPTDELLSGRLDKKGYSKMLSVQYLAYESLENHLQKQLVFFPDLQEFYQSKSKWLVADLEGMNVQVPMGLEDKHSILGKAELLGMMYVLEGSMLGGQVLMKSIAKNKNLAHLPHRFYRGNGKHTGRRWRDFTRICEQAIMENEVEKAIAGAQYTFDFFAIVFRRMNEE